jgi:acetyltransferase-like isoleucine patch superfamily enzyme
MIVSNIKLGKDVVVDPSSSINNVTLGDNVKIAKNCSIFGSSEHPLIIGNGSYIAMMSILNGYNAPLTIGERVSIAQKVNIMTDSGPNASPILQKAFPLQKGPVEIGNDCWIGTDVVIMPNVKIGSFCVIAAKSFVYSSFDNYSVIGGNPARLIRKLTKEELEQMGISI